MHEQILDALRRGAHAEALETARAAVDADAGDARAHHLLALALRADGDTAAAMASIERAIALAPDDPGLHFQRAGFLIGERDVDRAQQELTRTIELDPNRLGAYVLQAELAVGRGDLDEAERLVRVAERIAPDDSVLASVQGMIALRRGDNARALSILAAARERRPDDAQILNALGFAYLANGHAAFAEQSFRRLRELGVGGPALRRLLADVVRRQGRPEEALAELMPLLEDAQQTSPLDLRAAGELALGLGRTSEGLQRLRGALAAMPDDPRTLGLMMEAWRRQGDAEDARRTLDAAVATSPGTEQLWRARFVVEGGAAERAADVVARWLAAMPDSVGAHEAQLALHSAGDDAAAAEATARRIVALEPGNLTAEGRLLDILMRRDPDAALRHAEDLLLLPRDEETGRLVRGWLALANDGVGRFSEAARIWTALHAEVAERLIPLPAWSPPDAPRKPAAQAAQDAPALAFLAGLPGSGIEYVARLLEGIVPAFRADRVGGRPPQDPLQNVNTIPRLAAGELDPAEVAAQWRAALPARGLDANGAVIDWLLWWDNALLDVIGPHLPQARVLIVLRDPRDMLLNWLAFGTPVPLRLGAPDTAARWLAAALEHVVALQAQDRQPHTVLRVDEAINAPQALAGPVGQALGLTLPPPPQGLFGGRRFDAGRWRDYAGELAGAFALLTPVAVRLGYPET